MLFFLINLAFANPNEETQTTNQPTQSVQNSNSDSEFDFLSEKKESKTNKKDMDFEDSEFMIDASLMHSNDSVLVPQADDSFLLPEKQDADTKVETLPEDNLILSDDIGLEEAPQSNENVPAVNINSTESYDSLMGDLE